MLVALLTVVSAASAANSTGFPTCQELPEWGAPVGIALSSFASVGINIGQNMQADGIRALPKELQMAPYKSRVWIIGETVFISCSMVNFAALALAPASVLVPLESIQFVTNVAYSAIIHKASIPAKMILGVMLAVVGTVLTVVFGASGDSCHSLAHLEWAWTSAIWWTWMGLSISVAVACLHVHRVYDAAVKAGRRPRYHQYVLPITFTLSSALLGGSQMIVQSKVFSELLAMIFQGYFAPLTSWLLYVSLVLVIGCGMLWMVRLTVCLGLYDPIIILPLMVATYILFGGIAGGIYFREFDTLHLGLVGYWGWVLYVGGMACVLLGLYFIAVSGTAAEEETNSQESQGTGEFNASNKWRSVKVIVASGNLWRFGANIRDSGRLSSDSLSNGALMPSPSELGHPALLLASSLSFGRGQGDGVAGSKSGGDQGPRAEAEGPRAEADRRGSLGAKTISFQPGAGRLSLMQPKSPALLAEAKRASFPKEVVLTDFGDVESREGGSAPDPPASSGSTMAVDKRVSMPIEKRGSVVPPAKTRLQSDRI